MTGPFATIGTALSGMRHSTVALDVAAGNVANVDTKGYTRRRVEAETVGAPARPAMWSRADTAGYGVRVSGLTRMADPFLDARARTEHGRQSALDVQQSSLERIEAGIAEPSDDGLAATLAQFRAAWQDLANDPGSDAARTQVLARARTVAETFAAQSRRVASEATDLRTSARSLVDEANTVAAELAQTNGTIAVATLTGADASTLLDRRDLLAMRLSELTGGRATPGAQGSLDVTVAGQPLVTGKTANTLQIASGIAADGSSDGSPLAFALVDAAGTTTAVAGALGGEVGATAQLLNTDLPQYLASLDDVARTLADTVNTQHAAGFDAHGAAGQPLFGYDPTSAAASLMVAISDPQQLAASALAGGVLDGSNADLLGSVNPAEQAYQRLVDGFATKVATVTRTATNQQLLTDQVDGSREELSGVNLDEEMLTMVTHQRAYEASARVLTTVDSMLDTLINRTGLLR